MTPRQPGAVQNVQLSRQTSQAAKPGSKRTRQFKPKVKSGCLTCKIRRIKCDEEKPHCQKCTSTGRKCDGYVVEPCQRNSQSRETSHDRTCNSRNALVLASRDVSQRSTPRSVNFIGCGVVGNEQERRCFYFFQQQAVSQLAGACDSEFWNRFVLQAAHHNPAIRHAAIALGSLYEKLVFGERKTTKASTRITPDIFAVQQYVKAIGCLLEPVARGGHQALDAALMTCILFVCFELIRGHNGSALSHINSGSKILSELQANKKKTKVIRYAPLDQITGMMERLDMQATMMLSHRPLLLVGRSQGGMECTFCPKIPECFSSLEEARRCFDIIWSASIRLLYSLASTHLMQDIYGKCRRRLLDMLEAWSQALEKFLKTPNRKLEKADLQTADLLQLQKITIVINMDIENPTEAALNQTEWDKYSLEMEEIVTLATCIIGRPNDVAGDREGRCTFSLDTGIIVPLYIVASRSRDPVLRRKAISLLRRSDRQEGMWNSGQVARVLDRFVEIEELGIDENGYVPIWSRVTDVHVKPDPESKRALIKYCQRRGSDAEMNIFQEWIE